MIDYQDVMFHDVDNLDTKTIPVSGKQLRENLYYS